MDNWISCFISTWYILCKDNLALLNKSQITNLPHIGASAHFGHCHPKVVSPLEACDGAGSGTGMGMVYGGGIELSSVSGTGMGMVYGGGIELSSVGAVVDWCSGIS